MPDPTPPDVRLREVSQDDLPILFEHQHDPIANRLAAVPAREWDAFVTHWTTIVLPSTHGYSRAILADERVVGSILSFEVSGELLVGYWIGRDDWGKGYASRALALFLADVETRRPLHAHVASHNAGSLRVLEKCGFVVAGGEAVEENGLRFDDIFLRLDAP